MYKIFKKTLLIAKLTIVLLAVGLLQVSAKSPSAVTKAAEAPQKSVTGKVVDGTGEGLPGVTVKIKGTQVAVVTDPQGNYKITSADDNATLVFSFVGFKDQEASIRNRAVVNITLEAANTDLDEVVVVAYGTQKRTSVTGAVGTISSSEIRKNSVSDITNTLTGRAPGIRVTQLSSQPGKFSSQIDIRGFSTPTKTDGIDPGQQGGPLYVIDGVPRDKSAFDHLDPNEIENFSILKDATAAIYGVKAANGVILVTTRKGSQGKAQVNYSGQWGSAFILNYPELANAWQYATLSDERDFNERETSRGEPVSPLYTAKQIADWKSGAAPSVDWLKLTLKNRTSQQQHNVTVSGGSDKIKFFTSGGYFNEGGLFTSNIERAQKYNFRQSITAEIAKGLTFDVNIGMNDVVSRGANGGSGNTYGLIKSTWQLVPVETIYSNGDPKFFRQFDKQTNDNPIAVLDPNVAGYTTGNDRRYTSTFMLNYVIPQVKGLSAKVLVAYDNNYQVTKDYQKTFSQYQFLSGKQVEYVHGTSAIYNNFNEGVKNDLQFSLAYQNHFGKHNISALALYEEVYNRGNNINASSLFKIDALPFLDAANDANDAAAGGQNENTNRSWVGRINYDYAGKYLIEGGFRSDASSYFPVNSRVGLFPYVSAGWRISEESFIKNNYKFVDNIKLRASYGRLGDDQGAADRFPAFTTGYTYPSKGSVYDKDSNRAGGSVIGSVFGPSGGITKGIDFKSIANTNITWYTSTTSDIGLEMSFWNGKLSFEADVFRRDRDGLLTQRIAAIPGTFGAVQPDENINSDRVQGYEITLGHRSRIGEVGYSITANIGYTRRNWRHFEETPGNQPYDTYRNKSSDRYTDNVWGYTVLGQYQNYQEIYSSPIVDGNGNRGVLPGDFKYADLNGDGIINQQGDYRIIAQGGAKPLTYFGSTIDVNWKSLDLSMLIQGATRYSVMYQDQLSRPFYFTPSDPLTYYFDRWHRENLFDQNSPWVPGTNPSTGQRQNYKDLKDVTQGNTHNTFDGTYVRLKQIQIGYSLPKKLLSKVNISRLRIFATAYNLLTYSKGLKFVDPEYTNTNLYGYNYPTTLNVNVGAQLTF